MLNKSFVRLFVCISFAILALALFTGPMSACDQKTTPPTDDIRITRTADGDVTIDVQGPTTFLVRDIWPESGFKGRWTLYIDITTRQGVYRAQHTFRSVRSLNLTNVVCQVRKREVKFFTSNFAAFTLVKGPDANPGEFLSVKGTFTWNAKDHNDFFFHEEGTGRVWKTAPPPKEEKKNK